MARIIWSPTARHRLDEIVNFIAQDSPSAAREVHQSLLRAVRRIGRWPHSGVWVGARYEHLAGLETDYRVVVIRPYLVFYRVREHAGGEVLVLTVRHGAQLPPAAEVLTSAE